MRTKDWDIPTVKNYNNNLLPKNDLELSQEEFDKRVKKYSRINSSGSSHLKIGEIFERVKQCPCDNCGYYDKCAVEHLACRKYADWLQMGRLKRREVN